MPRNWNYHFPTPEDSKFTSVPYTKQQLDEFFKHKSTSVPYTKQQLDEFFKHHDKNGDKLLSKGELKKAFDDLQSRNPGFRAWRAMGKADTDGDQHISQQEMEALLNYAVGIKYQIKA